MKLLVEAPLNSLSFGNVSLNILREFYKKNIDVGIFPIGNLDISTFEVSQDFGQWLQKSIDARFNYLSKDIPGFKLWHLNGSENRKNSTQNLLTFYECSEPTELEKTLCKAQDKVFFSSTYSRDKFLSNGCENATYIPMGFDKDFTRTNKKYLEGVIHFGLMGKFENRKHTGKIIKSWLKKYGNDNKYQLTCCITNPFFKPEQMQSIIENVLEGKRYTNINFLPYLKTNKEVNEFLNAIDIDLTGLSLSEGWNLPAFNATCLGKWSIVHNATAHKDWANNENSILVESESEIECYDQVFFQKGSDFNQGKWPIYSDESMISAMEMAEKKSGQLNFEGIKLSEKFTYSNTADLLLKKIFE
jgi:hypothetical protein